MWGLRGLGLVTAFAAAVQSISVDDIRNKFPGEFYVSNSYNLIKICYFITAANMDISL